MRCNDVFDSVAYRLIAVQRMISGVEGLKLASSTSDEVSPTDGMLLILEEISVVNEIPLCGIFNFYLITHINNGKSSLASHVIYITSKQGREAQAMDLKETDES